MYECSYHQTIATTTTLTTYLRRLVMSDEQVVDDVESESFCLALIEVEDVAFADCAIPAIQMVTKALNKYTRRRDEQLTKTSTVIIFTKSK